jgi:heme exporter protein A
LNLNQALIAKELTCVRGDTELFRNLSFEISPGSILQITGGNGSGKSSLLRILCGLLSPQDGQVLWGQNPIHDDRDYFHSQLLYLGHQPALKGDLTAIENLISQAALSGIALSTQEAKKIILDLNLQGVSGRPIRTLSQGQKQRVGLAKLLIQPKKMIWILDEPLNALDQATSEAIETMLLRHASENGIIVFSSHLPLALATQYSQYRTIDLNAKP